MIASSHRRARCAGLARNAAQMSQTMHRHWLVGAAALVVLALARSRPRLGAA